MYDGKLAIQGDGVSVDIIADTKSDVFALKIDDSRPSPSAITIDLVMLQDPDVTIGTHTAVLRTSDSDGQISLQQTFKQPAATGYTEFDHYCSSALVIDVKGRSASVSYPDAKTIRLTLPAGNETFYVYMASDASMERSANTVADATETVDVGTQGTSNDPNGYLALASLATAGLVQGDLVDGSITLGVLLYEETGTGVDVAYARRADITAGGDPISYTCSAGSDTA